MFANLRLSLFSLLLVGSLSAEALPWEQLKVGMTADQGITLLGDPMLRSKGRGFETWTYDDGAEVLVYGLVVGWTAPVASDLPARSQDVWSNHPRGDYFTTLRSAVRKSAAKPTAVIAAKPVREIPRNTAGLGYEEYLRTLARTKG